MRLSVFRSTVLAILVAYSVPLSQAADNKAFKLPACPSVTDMAPSREALPPINLGGKAKAPENLRETSNPSHIEQAKKANLMPLPLLPSASESQNAANLEAEEHKKQLSELWQATIEKSSDIQFAIALLQPSSNQSHKAAAAARVISSTLFNVGGLMAPPGAAGMASRLGIGAGASITDQLLSGGSKSKQARATSDQTFIVYFVVRNVADKLVDDYRAYRLALTELDSAIANLQDLRQLEGIAAESKDNVRYQSILADLHKSQRAETICEHRVSFYRQKLADVAGVNAVSKLDESIESEKIALLELIGKQDTTMHAQPGQSAAVREKSLPLIEN